jgi:hypothetical protein
MISRTSQSWPDGVAIELEEVTAQTAKRYYERYGVGTTKYTVYFHDGVKTHRDGSEFFDVEMFRNRKKKDAFIRDLQTRGYAERGI